MWPGRSSASSGLPRRSTRGTRQASWKTAPPERRLPPFVLNLATRGAMAAADVYAAEIINAERLFDLLTPAGVEFFAGSRVSPPRWPPNLRNIGKLIANAEYRGRNFYLSLPLYAQPQEQYRVRLKLTVWKWKLAGIDLPEAIQQRLAQEFAMCSWAREPNRHPSPRHAADGCCIVPKVALPLEC